MKLPVMKFELDNDTIVDAIKSAVEAGGISLAGKHVRIEFKAKRKGAGLNATVEVSSDPFLEASPATATAGDTDTSTPAEETADVAEPEVAAEEPAQEEAEQAVTKTKKKPLFDK